MNATSKKLSIVIPVYNEAAILESVLIRAWMVEFPLEREFVIIDDCSTDGSWEVIQRFAATHPMQTIRQPKNCGKGAALRRGFEVATGDIIAVHDADFEYDLRDMPALVQPLIDDQADVVYGSRFRSNSPQVHRTFHYLINRLLTMLSNVVSGLYLSDMETCYKVIPSVVLKALPLSSDRFGFEPEVTAYLAKLNLRVHEYPISYHPRNYLQGKKINWRDGLAAFWFIVKFNTLPLPNATLEKLPSRYHPRRQQWL